MGVLALDFGGVRAAFDLQLVHPLGHGNFVAQFAAGLPIQYNSPVNASEGIVTDSPDGKFGAMFSKWWGTNMCYIDLGGPSCTEAEQGGEAGLIALASHRLAHILGPDTLSHITRTACHSWKNDPWAMGAYTTAIPGHVQSRIALQTPVQDRIFFAGEAAALEGGTSMDGAWISGQAAVAKIVRTRKALSDRR